MHRMVELACSTLHVMQSASDVQRDGVKLRLHSHDFIWLAHCSEVSPSLL